jgi:hypothetical protein
MGRIGALGDAAFKINEAIPGYVDTNTIYDLTGIRPAEGVTNGTGGGTSGAGALGSYFNRVSEQNDDGQETGPAE